MTAQEHQLLSLDKLAGPTVRSRCRQTRMEWNVSNSFSELLYVHLFQVFDSELRENVKYPDFILTKPLPRQPPTPHNIGIIEIKTSSRPEEGNIQNGKLSVELAVLNPLTLLTTRTKLAPPCYVFEDFVPA